MLHLKKACDASPQQSRKQSEGEGRYEGPRVSTCRHENGLSPKTEVKHDCQPCLEVGGQIESFYIIPNSLGNTELLAGNVECPKQVLLGTIVVLN